MQRTDSAFVRISRRHPTFYPSFCVRLWMDDYEALFDPANHDIVLEESVDDDDDDDEECFSWIIRHLPIYRSPICADYP
jgi:hypothetical protein